AVPDQVRIAVGGLLAAGRGDIDLAEIREARQGTGGTGRGDRHDEGPAARGSQMIIRRLVACGSHHHDALIVNGFRRDILRIVHVAGIYGGEERVRTVAHVDGDDLQL